jgi:long-chain fatty acid transport protein
MKRLVVFLCVSALVSAVASPLMAGGIDNKQNWSAEYIRTLNRNAATDSADAVVYNPAGVVKMPDGFYVNLAGQYVYKEYTNTFGGRDFDTDEPDLVPSLFALFRKDQWAAFGSINVVCGGGTVEYDDGNADTFEIGSGMAGFLNAFVAPGHVLRAHEVDGESFHTAFGLGGAYQLNDWISASLGVRYVDAIFEADGSTTITGPAGGIFEIDFEDTGDGWGGVLGVDIVPAEKWNIGIRYETEVDLELEADVDKDDFGGNVVADGRERDRDLPAVLALGVSHQCTPKLKSDVNFTYYFNEDADLEPILAGREDDVDNGFDLGISVEYAFMPELKGSVGYMYTYVGEDAADINFLEPKLDAHSIAAGVAYEAMPGLTLNFGIMNVFYQDETSTPDPPLFPAGVKLEKDPVVVVALGVQYKFW